MDALKMFRLFLLSALMLKVAACASRDGVCEAASSSTIQINGEEWRIVLEAEQCEGRALLAIERYLSAPLYRTERGVSRERLFVNEGEDCWVELYVAGVSDLTIIYRLKSEGIIVDERLFSYWLPHIRPYPETPYE